MQNTLVDIETVADFWNSRPCNLKHSQKEVGTKEYFKEVYKRKFFVEPHLPIFAEFGKWSGKNVLEIGCFIGSTKVSLLNGDEMSLMDIHSKYKESEFWVYSCDKDGKIIPAKAKSLGVTRKNAELIEITLDNDEIVKCTLDHKWMLRDGTYIEARFLKEGDSLMPLYRRLSKKGYTEALNLHNNKWKLVHKIVGEKKYGENFNETPVHEGCKNILHHVDVDKLNNEPDNLELMCWCHHAKVHQDLITNNKIWSNPKIRERLIPAFRERMAKRNSDPELIKKQIAGKIKSGATERNRQRMIESNKNPEMIKKMIQSRRDNGQLAAVGIRTAISNKDPEMKVKRTHFRWHVLKEEKTKGCPHCFPNHKVKSVSICEEKEDVYCLNVPNYHNFALSSGVFVHNCGLGATAMGFTKAGANLTGIELSEKSLELCKKSFEVFRETADLYLGNAENLSYYVPHKHYDLIFSFGVIHHSPKSEDIMKEIHYLAAKNTVVKIMIYAKWSFKGLYFFMTDGWRFGFNYNKTIQWHAEAQSNCPVAKVYSAKEVRELCKDFKIVSMKKSHIFPYKIKDYIQYKYTKVWYFRIMPKKLFKFLESVLGWHWCLTLKKK